MNVRAFYVLFWYRYVGITFLGYFICLGVFVLLLLYFRFLTFFGDLIFGDLFRLVIFLDILVFLGSGVGGCVCAERVLVNGCGYVCDGIMLWQRQVRMKCLKLVAISGGWSVHEYVCECGWNRYMYTCMRRYTLQL